MKAADVARELHDMDPVLRTAVVKAMEDDRLAEALEELPEDEQVDVIASLDTCLLYTSVHLAGDCGGFDRRVRLHHLRWRRGQVGRVAERDGGQVGND